MNQTLPLFVALAISLALTPVVRMLATRRGWIARPVVDRWHKRPTAMMGGIAIMLSAVLAWAATASRMPAESWTVLGTSVLLGLVGLVDDLVKIKPYQKLIGQVLGAALVISAGLVLPWTASATINIALTFFWLIGITNAINLLDNMDGLAAGVAAIAAVFLGVNLYLNGMDAAALMCGIVAAVLIGFLVYNSSPASIFMGDCGSMFIGFFLASAALLSTTGARSRSFVVVIVVPLLVLLIPIFDTTLVTVARKLAGRAASQGGRDHASHRLVALGLSERRAVWLLYGLAAMSGVLAILVGRMTDAAAGIAMVTAFAIGLSLLGVYLAGVRVYDEEEIRSARERPFISFFFDLSYKRRLFEVSLDLVLILLAFFVASALVMHSARGLIAWPLFARQTSIVVGVQLLSLLAAGAYRGLWRYVSIDDLIVYTRGVALGAVAGYLTVRAIPGVPRIPGSVMLIQGMVLLLLIASSRIAFRVLRWLLPDGRSTGGRRALIYGAGDAGELLLRELMNNRALGFTAIGFIDDDSLKVGKRIHGLKVAAGNGTLLDTCRKTGAHAVLISSLKISEERLDEIREVCAQAGIELRRMNLTLEPVSDPSDASIAFAKLSATENGGRPAESFNAAAASRRRMVRHQ